MFSETQRPIYVLCLDECNIRLPASWSPFRPHSSLLSILVPVEEGVQQTFFVQLLDISFEERLIIKGAFGVVRLENIDIS